MKKLYKAKKIKFVKWWLEIQPINKIHLITVYIIAYNNFTLCYS